MVNGQPRHVRNALSQIRDYVANNESNLVPTLMAPYELLDSHALCRERGGGSIDLQGNAY